MGGVMEIITGRERRRRWSTTEKLRIVGEAAEPDAVMRAVAARHGICESLLFAWRRQARAGLLRGAETPAFVPVQAFDAPRNTAAPPAFASDRTASSVETAVPSGLIEITLPDGTSIKVGHDVALETLRRIMVALRR